MTTTPQNFENELKLAILSVTTVTTKLLNLGATYIQTEIQEDTYFKREINSIHGENIRMRSVVDNEGNKYGYFTYKGPLKKEARFLKRAEYETRVDNPEKLLAILTCLGYTIIDTITKTRAYYELKDMNIGVDCVEKLGTFIEIEGEDENIIDLAQRLHLDPQQHINKSYSTLRDELT